MITRQSDTIWTQSAAGRGHQHRPAYDTPHAYHADKAAREYGEALGTKHRTEAEHADQPRDKRGRFLPMPHHEKEKKDAAESVRRKGGSDLEQHFHHGYQRAYENPELVPHHKKDVQEEHHDIGHGRAAKVAGWDDTGGPYCPTCGRGSQPGGPVWNIDELLYGDHELQRRELEESPYRDLLGYREDQVPTRMTREEAGYSPDNSHYCLHCNKEFNPESEGNFAPYHPDEGYELGSLSATEEEEDPEDPGDPYADLTAPWEQYAQDPEEERLWAANPTRIPKIPRPHERTMAKNPYLLELNEIANASGLRPKGLHLSQPKDMVGHLISEPQHYFNDDQTHNFSTVHHVIDPAHSKSGMWEVHRWKYSSDPKVGGSVEVTHHLPGENAIRDVVGQLDANLDWDKHEGIGGRRVNKEWEERYIHDHPANNSMLDPIQYEIRFINAHRKTPGGGSEYYYDPDATNARWMPHPNDPKKQFQGPHWLVTTKLWQRQHPFDPRSEGRYMTVDHQLFHPDDAHGALRYVYADQHGGSLRPRQGSIFSHLF